MVVELIKRYCLKKGVEEEVVLNELMNFIEMWKQVERLPIAFAKIDDEGLEGFGFDKTYGLRLEDYKTLFFHAVDAAKNEVWDALTLESKSIDNDVYLFCRDNWQLINDVKGPLLKKYFDDFVEKYNKKRLNRKEFIKRIKQFTGEPTTKWVDGAARKVYNLMNEYKRKFETREKELFDELVEAAPMHSSESGTEKG